MAAPLKVVMFLGSTREGRNALRVAKFMKTQLEARHNSVHIMDPCELQLPLLERPLHWYQDPATAPAVLTQCNQVIVDADAFVVVATEYNNAIAPALTNLMSHFGNQGYMYKPSGIVTYSMGQFGGVIAGMQLRAFLGELGCLSVSKVFSVPEVHKSISEDGVGNERLVKNCVRLLTQLEWHAQAMRAMREREGVPEFFPYEI